MGEAIQPIRADKHVPLVTLGELGHFPSAGRMIIEHGQEPWAGRTYRLPLLSSC